MKKYKSTHISFVYPENWTLFENDGDEVSGEDETNEVTLQNPNGSQWTVALYGKEETTDSLVKRAIAVFESEYEDLEIENTTESVGDCKLSGVDINFFLLDLLVVAEIRILERANDNLLIILQSESKELDENREVFQAIFLSLLNPDLADSF
jgi:hypothetical protein